METRRLRVPVLILAAMTLSVPSLTSAQLVMNEAGFDVTDLGAGQGPKGAECSPGGVWGNYIYIGESGGNAIERIDFADTPFFFAGGSPDIDFPVGMDFGPGPAANFGTYLYVASFGSGRITRLDPGGTPSLFTLFGSVSDVKFDPTGAYSTDLFAIQYFGPIFTVDTGGTASLFSAGVTSSYFRFGPGGAWGTGMYATNSLAPNVGEIVTIDAGGAPATFTAGLDTPEQFDWAFGGAWGGDMFLNDFGAATIYRVKSDGTKTVFASTARPAGMVFCNDCLYITSYQGGCWKVCESAVTTEPATWSSVKQTYGSEE